MLPSLIYNGTYVFSLLLDIQSLHPRCWPRRSPASSNVNNKTNPGDDYWVVFVLCLPSNSTDIILTLSLLDSQRSNHDRLSSINEKMKKQFFIA